MKGKRIILGVTGSIAAYKAAILLRLLSKAGAEVQVIITPAGKEFITPVTLSALSGKPVESEFFASTDGSWHSHVDLGLWADAMLIAPCSANTLGKLANGICDNLLTTTYMSAKCPVFIAPAMDLDMYRHPSNQKNIDILKSFGAILIDPGTGELASGLCGKGRMEEPEKILEILQHHFQTQQRFSGKKVLISAGPTFEKIDPVRYIGNFSSGKMGYAIAEEFARQGAQVCLVSGPTHLNTQHPSIQRVDVVSAAEMHADCLLHSKESDILILSAAVADYTPVNPSQNKHKRKNEDLQLHLKPTADIAAELGSHKKNGQLIVGFALETDHEEENARKKLIAKNLDLIILNSLNSPGAGFQTDTNQIKIIYPDNKITSFELKSKIEVAKDICNSIFEIL
jgi:phosphopantothenoylcysteine decarboxylase / phosphopantothenate---cysteine ligase